MEVLRAWLESRVEDDGMRMPFVAVRRSLNMIARFIMRFLEETDAFL
jgi:hypothetical protein